jgi:hypothetical protein
MLVLRLAEKKSLGKAELECAVGTLQNLQLSGSGLGKGAGEQTDQKTGQHYSTGPTLHSEIVAKTTRSTDTFSVVTDEIRGLRSKPLRRDQ